jgi:poly-beta-1,6-N-acetyl-D-glucosamine biosynthesis protein PgaD
VLGARSQPEVLHLLGLYAVVIGAILVSMLMMAPWRRRQHRREAPPEQEQSSLFALASYIEVPPARLSTWQRTRQLLVHHDNNGHLRDATDTAPGLLEPEPLQRAAARR